MRATFLLCTAALVSLLLGACADNQGEVSRGVEEVPEQALAPEPKEAIPPEAIQVGKNGLSIVPTEDGAGDETAGLTPVERAQLSFKEAKKAEQAAQESDIDAAIAHYEKVLELTPNASRYRFEYAQLLYQKGLAFSEESHRAFQKSLGRVFDSEKGEWSQSEAALQEGEKLELANKSTELDRQSQVYFNKSLMQLMRCDADWNYAVERVPEAMAMVYVQMEDYDNALAAFKRILDSPRTTEEYREKMNKVIERIEQQKKNTPEEK